jgi:hypothetical protein
MADGVQKTAYATEQGQNWLNLWRSIVALQTIVWDGGSSVGITATYVLNGTGTPIRFLPRANIISS